ncbi:MAG: SulP family inorganic anion transporter [Planctomycetaceae bacterium]
MSEATTHSTTGGFHPATITNKQKPTDPELLKPQNGLAGLKHWPYDLRSGFMVAMVSLPFSMGIAITSGAPPVCGVISAIIAGFVLPFAGGSYVTISGPAAGLAPALFAGMISLATAEIGAQAAAGKTTAELLAIGYPLVLVAIAIAGVLQVILARFKVARLSAIFPAAAIEGMLAAIGLLIMVKQLPLLFGTAFEAHEFWEILAEAPHHFSEIHSGVLITGVACTAALFILNALPFKLLKVMPPPVWVFIGGAIASQLFIGIDPEYCIHIPENPLQSGMRLPSFDRIFSAPHTWLSLAYIIVLLILIDATESLATIMAVDKLDPYKRRSDPDRTLQSMGICNTASSIVGGLTIIPGIVKSTANIIGGGRTLWANFFNAVMLVVFLTLGRSLINQVPLAVLAAILIFIGWKLCGPKVWKHIAKIGPEQLGVFLLTIVVTVSTDLLIGIGVGVFVKLLMNMSLIRLANRISGVSRNGGFLSHFKGLFKNPAGKKEFHDGVYDLTFERPLHCFNLLHVIREMQNVPEGTKTLRLHFAPLSNVIDHTSVETIFHYVEDYKLKGIQVELDGWDRFVPLSEHDGAVRFGPIERPSDRTTDAGPLTPAE